VQGKEQTRIGRWFDRHPMPLRAFALCALVWGVGYLIWRIGWSGEGASPVAFAMLLVTEIYGLWALGTLAWYSWSRPPAMRPPATSGRKIDVYVCTYDEPFEVVAATLAGCRALTYPHATYLLDDGRRAEMEELARVAGAEYLTRPDNSHAKAGNINAALSRTEGELVLMLGLVMWTDELPMKISVVALAALWLPSISLNLLAGSALTRGYMKIGETAHYELLTMEIYTRALRCIFRPGHTAFKVTPKQGVDGGGIAAVRKLRLVILAGVVLAGGTAMRLLDLAGVGPLPDLPGIAAVIVPVLGLVELRRVLRTLLAVGKRQQRRQVYRFEGSAAAHGFATAGHIGGRLVDASAAGVGLVLDAPVSVGERPAVLLELEEATGEAHEVAAQVEIRSCREVDGHYLVGATIEEMDPSSRMRLMEWCYVVCSHERLRGRRPAVPAPESEAIVMPLDAAPAPVPTLKRHKKPPRTCLGAYQGLKPLTTARRPLAVVPEGAPSEQELL
jgi:hypothetical protein